MANEAALTDHTARQVLEVVCQGVGLDPAGAELIGIGSNAVYRLAKPVIVRITADGDGLDSARRQVAVARWLETERYPATRALDVEQPVEHGGLVVTLWESASEREEYAPSSTLRGSSAGTRRLLRLYVLLRAEAVEARPLFIRVGDVGLRKSSSPARMISAMEAVVESRARLNEVQRLAYDLYAASFSESNADARFMMLMMALETLIDDIEKLLAQSGLPRSEVASMRGKLKWFRVEAISRAGKRLAARLAGRVYMDEDPELRSSFVHGANPRPGREVIASRAASLEHFVADLICATVVE